MNSKRSIPCIPAMLVLLLAVGCEYERPTYHDIKAEITSIQKSSDTSILLRIDVLDEGNSDACRLKIFFDTISIERRSSLRSAFVTSVVGDCRLDKSYALTVSQLLKGEEYFFQLFQEASWSTNGPSSFKYRFIGAQKTFTIQ